MIRLRPALNTDLSLMVALDQEIFGSYGAQEDPQVIASRLRVFPQGCYIMEDHSDEVTIPAGYLTTEKWTELREPVLDENPDESHRTSGQILCITTLAVAPAFQRRGLGRRLLDQAIATAVSETCTDIILETANARDWYLLQGFTLWKEWSQRKIPMFIMHMNLKNTNHLPQ